MARKGQSRVWAAGFAGFKVCPQHNTTPVQCDISCQPQRDTSHPESHPFMVLTHLPAFLLPPPHVTGCDMHTHTHISQVHPPVDQPAPGSITQQGHHGAGSPLPPPSLGHSKGYFQTGALPVPGKQWDICGDPGWANHSPGLPGALATDPPQELLAQCNPGKCDLAWETEDLGSGVPWPCELPDLGQVSIPLWPRLLKKVWIKQHLSYLIPSTHT